MPGNTRRRTVLLAAALAAAGCAPGTEWDHQVGRKYAAMVAAEMGLVDDPELEAYLNTVGHRLAACVPDRSFDFTFQVVDMETPNAFALPGGYVYVSRGLLMLTNSEDELANVLGHEIGHVEHRDSAQLHGAAALPGLLTLPGDAVGAVVSPALGDALASPFRTAGQAYLAGYGRDQERRADAFAQTTAARAGYDPLGMHTVLQSLERDQVLRVGESRGASFFDSHPPNPQRAATTAKQAAGLRWSRGPGTSPDRAAYLRRLDGLVVGHDPAQGVFRDELFLHPVLDYTLQMPEGWTTAHARWAIGAVAPQRDAILIVGTPSPGTDPRQRAEAYLDQIDGELNILVTRAEPARFAGLPGYVVSARLGPGDTGSHLELAWIAHKRRIFQVTGVTAARQVDKIEAIRSSAATFRPLAEAQRRTIGVARLRLATARPGESLAQLGARVESAWSVEQTAVANGLAVDEVLESGRLVKVAVVEPFSP